MKKILVIFSAALVFLLILAYFYQLQIKQQEVLRQAQDELLRPKGQMVIESKTEEHQLISPSVFTVFADSAGSAMTGYDVVLLYDASKLRYVSSQSETEDFQIVPSIKENKVYITGIKNPKVTTVSKFKYTPLVSFTFQPLVRGKIGLEIEYLGDSKADSNLMNDKTEDILSEVQGLSFEVR